ncbi:hypothetical protein SAMN02745673_02381 [Marinactinospora thermotolerans DSM 45154]|uniref:Uncharacterized protein n=1 Tax=Marinactinospora thermotolerans DSM 45154 TaxID=1122192 RepID=A0A1T4QRC7_9ACTN|nr:hypothetical protein [Marinactinospora thermotolerans]SKA06244.1 hypothetical protein SAMN02745673_02381 [Marinactinospora thermotolerans DSM 45154]
MDETITVAHPIKPRLLRARIRHTAYRRAPGRDARPTAEATGTRTAGTDGAGPAQVARRAVRRRPSRRAG